MTKVDETKCSSLLNWVSLGEKTMFLTLLLLWAWFPQLQMIAPILSLGWGGIMEPDGLIWITRYKGTVVGSAMLCAWTMDPQLKRGKLVERSRERERARSLRLRILLKLSKGLRGTRRRGRLRSWLAGESGLSISGAVASVLQRGRWCKHMG